MLTDSKVRKAGLIRNSSSRKILHQPESQKRKSPNSSDDSFSSFQYEGNSKMSYQSKKPQPKIIYQHIKSLEKKTIKLPSPHIPPKPEKRLQIKQPSFTNQRLKNNFFQQPMNKSQFMNKQKSKQRHPPINKPMKELYPRTPTPQFQQSTFKHKIQEVENICNRIEGMRIMEGNFSFNPKTNKFKKEKESDIRNKGLYQQQMSSISKQQISAIAAKKPKQNNYFNEPQNHKFQYDFESSSSSSDNQQQESNQYQSFGNRSQQRDDEAINYYKQQQQKKNQPYQQFVTKTVSKNNLYQNYQQSYPYQSQNYPKRVENQQSQDNNQQLITEYNKTDFGLKLTQQMRRNTALKNQQKRELQEQQQRVIQKHGGICFDVDVKQFNQGTGNNLSYQSTKKPYSLTKKKKVNQKQQLLRRRQMAKIYSKQARFRLFGFA